MTRIAVTGGTGHIGNALVRLLVSSGDDVRVAVPPGEDLAPLEGLPVDAVEADVRNIDSLREAFGGCDVVYHLAGVVSIWPGDGELLHQINVLGTRNVVNACLETGVRRLVYTSSIHALAEPPWGTTIDESCAYDPDQVIGEYARSKARATMEVLEASRKGLDAVIACPTGVIGPYDFKLSEMGRLVLTVMNSKLKAYVDGAYDFVDVRDVARGLVLVCREGLAGESYILSGEQVTIRDLLLMLQEITGVKAPSFRVPASLARSVGRLASFWHRLTKAKPLFTEYSIQVLSSNSVITSEKARRELGYSSRPIAESLRDAAEWFRMAGKAPPLTGQEPAADVR